MPSTRRFSGSGLPTLVCAVTTNMASAHEPKDSKGLPVRIAGRQHKWAHAQAAALRHLLPLLPTAEADPLGWLDRQHNLSAALAELE